MTASEIVVGSTVTLREDRPAWYSGYGMNPARVIRAGEQLTITHTGVTAVRGRGSYNVARTDDGWQVSFTDGEAI